MNDMRPDKDEVITALNVLVSEKDAEIERLREALIWALDNGNLGKVIPDGHREVIRAARSLNRVESSKVTEETNNG